MKKYLFSFYLLLICVFNQIAAKPVSDNSFYELIEQLESSGIEILKYNLTEVNAVFKSSSPHQRERNKEYLLLILEVEIEKEKESDDELTSYKKYSKCCQHFSIVYYLSEKGYFKESSQNEFPILTKEANFSFDQYLYLEFQVFRI